MRNQVTTLIELAHDYRGEDDYLAMQELQRELLVTAGPPVACTPGELDWWRFAEEDPDGEIASLRLWSRGGAVVAWAWPGKDYVDLSVLPPHADLVDPILAWAEERCEADFLTTECLEADAHAVSVLLRRGYRTTGKRMDARLRPLGEPVPEAPLPPGYAIRALEAEADVEARLAYPKTRYRPGLRSSPTFRADLDLAVFAPEGGIAAYCTVWFDERSGLGSFEPVACAEEHRRRGLASAVITEGLRRLLVLSATAATVRNHSSSEPAAGLYKSVGLRLIGRHAEWRKELRPEPG